MRDRPSDHQTAQRAVALSWTADAAFATSRFHEARKGYEQALELHRSAEYRHGVGLVLINLGAVDLCQGRLDASRAHLEEALAIHREQGEPRFMALAMGRLGALELDLGNLDRAAANLAVAHEIHQAAGERPYELAALLAIGRLHRAAGRLLEARVYLETALREARAILDDRLQTAAVTELGLLLQEEDQPADAIVELERALALLRRLDDAYAIAGVLRARAGLQLELADTTAMREDATQAQRLCDEVGDRHGLGEAVALFAVAEATSGRLDSARKHFEEAAARVADHPLLSVVVELHRGHLDLAEGSAGREAATRRLAAAEEGEAPPAGRSAGVRIAARLLREAMRR
jgi:tetratricopeptide (TPR) repeat protein